MRTGTGVTAAGVTQRGRGARARRTLIAAAIVLGASGCGDLTAGGVGDVEILVAPDSIAVTAASAPDGRVAGAMPTQQVTPPMIEGTLQVRIQVFVLRPPGRWLEITDGIQEVLLDLDDPAPLTVGRRTLAAGSYVAVRTVFHRVRADVTRGLEVDGEPVTGLVDVDLGVADRLEVFRPLDLTVSEGEVTEIGIDLHAFRWLRRLDRDLRRVAAGDFEDELGLRPRPRDFP